MIVDNKNIKKRKRGAKSSIALNPNYNIVLNGFIQWLDRLGYAKTTIYSHKKKLSRFLNYLQDHNVTTVKKIQHYHASNYNKWLHSKTIGSGHIKGQLNTIIRFSEYLEKTIGHKIVQGELPIEKSMTTQRTILTKAEVHYLFSSIGDTAIGLRNKALLHLYYGCGLRPTEGALLLPGHIDYRKKLLYVAPGKNYCSRYVPMSTAVAKALQDYQTYARMLINPCGHYFLVNPQTNSMNAKIVNRVLQKMMANLKINKHITLHCLRHSIATHLLEQGMPLEGIGKFLGHKTLDATQLYVRMTKQMINESTT